jgi:hypothetical protein
VFSGAIAKEMGMLQAANYADRTNSVATITIEDGTGQTAEFKGYSTGPRYGVMSGGVQRSVALVGRGALLDSLQMSIYRYDHAEFAEATTLRTGGSWAARFKAATEFLVKTGEQRFDDFSGADKERLAQKHARNKLMGLPVWYSLLDASMESSKSDALGRLAEGGSEDASATVNNGIANAILGVLMSPVNKFWQNIEQLCAMFQLVYVPDSKVGFLMTSGLVLRMPPVAKTVSEIQIDASATTSGILPLQQVVARAAAPQSFAETGEEQKIIAGWPVTAVATGNDMEVPMPGWLLSASVCAPGTPPEPLAVEVPGLDDPIDIDSYASQQSTVVQRASRAMNKAVDELLTEYVRNMWTEVSLASSTVQFTIPLDVSWRPGMRYEVSDKVSNGKLFIGWLAGVRHSLTITGAAGNTSGNGSSTLSFTHVTMGDFILPGA